MSRGRNSGLILIQVERMKKGKGRPKITLVKKKRKKDLSIKEETKNMT